MTLRVVGDLSSYSSAPHGRKPLPVEPPTREPKTWLLRVGWRRHGLLDPASVPGAAPTNAGKAAAAD